jgi:parvulin-like peptidyl-prolyl isomerase
MKKIAALFLSATLLSSPIAFAADGKVIASYTGGDVTDVEVMDQFKPVLEMQPENKGKTFSQLEKNIQEALVKGYINIKLIDQEAKRLGIRDSKEFKEKMANVEQQMIQQELIERHLKSALTDKMIDDEYTEMTKTFKGAEEVKTSHILVDTEEKAKEIKKKLNKGGDFAALVQEFSKDEGSKVNGGEIGYAMKGQLVPEYETKAFSMKKNEISDPVKTQFGWHIIKLLDKRAAKVPTKEQALPGIKNKLSREIIEKYFKELSDKAHIEMKL